MKAKRLKPLFDKYLLPSMPNFDFKGHHLFVAPIEYLLKGFYFNSSSYAADDFSIYYFILPLYGEYDSTPFIFGERLSGQWGQWWSLEDRSEEETMEDVLRTMLETGLPFFAKIQRPLDLAKYGCKKKESKDPHWWEPVAYSFILEGQQDKALEVIEHMERIYEDRKADVSFWYHDLIDRVRTVKVLLEKDPTEAVRRLLRWREQTLANLKLEEKAVKIEIP